MDLVGDRWSLPVVRELMFGPKRFSEIRTSLPQISAKMLTERLEDLQASGIIVKRRLPPPTSAQVYGLTEWGYASEPIFQTLGRWAAQSPTHDPTLPISAASVMLSFRTMIDAERAKGLEARVGFRFGPETFLARLSGGRIEIARGPVDGADVVFDTQPPLLAAAVYGGVPLEALEAQGDFRVEGDGALARRFVTFFPLPAKVSLEEG